MAEFFLELLSEEIPARMQARAAADLERLAADAFTALSPSGMRSFHGPRRLALAADLAAEVPVSVSSERGPRVSAPEQAVAGFLRKHGASREALSVEGAFWVLNRSAPAMPAAALMATALPALLRRFPWPKAMRWGGTSAFTWVRPLRRILCLLDGEVVPFDLAAGEDDGHGLRSGADTEGHRFLAPGAVGVAGVADWERVLTERRVIASAVERKRVIAEGLAALAAGRGLSVVEDAGLLDEVAGLVEWPVPLVGRIDDAFMDLPPEVMQVSMRVNQRYFATRDADGQPAPWFAFVANVEAPDGGAAIVAGNERVLRARFSDARHFWDLDRKVRLEDRVRTLDGVVFHADLGTQGDRVRRIVRLAGFLAPLVGADAALAERAALLAKADLATGMVGEFPELQGVMGGYYALHDGEDGRVADAVGDHYLPKGASDRVPAGPVAIAVALADKMDQLTGFFLIGQKPTGSGDPFALRRAALGVIRILTEHRIHMPLLQVFTHHAGLFETQHSGATSRDFAEELFDFVRERLRVVLRSDGAGHNALQAGFAGPRDDDVLRLTTRTRYLSEFLASPDGEGLLTAFARASNILRLEWKQEDEADADPALLLEAEECDLHAQLMEAGRSADLVAQGDYPGGLALLASLRAPVDRFFDRVLVNDPDPQIRTNRLRLLATVRRLMNRAAHFAAITG